MSVRDFLLEFPAAPPPPGVVPNFENPQGNVALALGIIIPCGILTLTTTLMRIYVKSFVVRKWHWDDYLLPVAFLFSAAEFAPTIHGYTYAPVIHQWDMTIRTISKFLLDFHVGAIFYFMTIMTLKIAILIQFLRIFVPAGERSKTYWATHVLVWMNTIFYIITVFIEIFACRPMRKQWDPLITDGKCVNSPLSYMISQSFNLALDVLILVWTQNVIWHLHMPLGRKLKLGILFFAGLLACIFGALSVWTTVKIMKVPNDQAYWAAWNALFTFPETTSGFLVLCLPVAPKFFKSMQTSLFPSTVRSTLPTHEPTPGPKSPPRSWWHITGASKLGSFLSTGKWTGTTATQNGDMDSRAPVHTIDGEKRDFAFITFSGPELDLQLACEDHAHAHLGPHTHADDPERSIAAIPTVSGSMGAHGHGYGALGHSSMHYSAGQDHDRIYRESETVSPISSHPGGMPGEGKMF